MLAFIATSHADEAHGLDEMMLQLMAFGFRPRYSLFDYARCLCRQHAPVYARAFSLSLYLSRRVELPP